MQLIGFNLVPMLPELWVLLMALVILMSGVFSSSKRLSYRLMQITLLIAVILTWIIFTKVYDKHTVMTMQGSFIFDPLSVYTKLFIYLEVLFSFLYAQSYNQDRGIPAVEFHVLGLLSMLGMMVLVSSYHVLVLFLGVELLALPTYAMIAMQRHKGDCIEASMKYFMMGAMASGLLLYGLSMVFGATQHLDIPGIMAASAAHQPLLLVLGLIFMVASLAFKLGAAPFHMWVPDVYQGAPTSVTTFLSAAPKIAIFVMLVRLLWEALPTVSIPWHHILIVLSVLSMLMGNIAAIIQTNIKRFLAYSSIAHMGYMLLGVLCATPEGMGAGMFYIISYSIATLAAFGLLAMMSQAGLEIEKVNDLAGLSDRHPWLAFMMLLLMFSLAGIPPLVGFIAKVEVLQALIHAHLVWLAIVAMLTAIIGAYYYLYVVKVMYFESSAVSRETKIVYPLGLTMILSINALAVLVIGLFPGWLYEMSSLF